MTNTILAAISVGGAYLLLALTCLYLLKKANACRRDAGKASFKIVMFLFWISSFAVLALSVFVSGSNYESQHSQVVELLDNIDKTYGQNL